MARNIDLGGDADITNLRIVRTKVAVGVVTFIRVTARAAATVMGGGSIIRILTHQAQAVKKTSFPLPKEA